MNRSSLLARLLASRTPAAAATVALDAPFPTAVWSVRSSASIDLVADPRQPGRL